MTAVRETALAAIETALAAIPGYDVERNPKETIDETTRFPSIHLYDGGHRHLNQFTGARQYEMTATAVIGIKPTSTQQVGTEINAAYLLVANALMGAANKASFVAAGILDVTESGMSEPVIIYDGDTSPLAAVEVDFLVTFWTKEEDVGLAGP